MGLSHEDTGVVLIRCAARHFTPAVRQVHDFGVSFHEIDGDWVGMNGPHEENCERGEILHF
jgi:hypothetical protein